MPASRKNNALRIAVPLIVLALGIIAIPVGIWQSKTTPPAKQGAGATAATTTAPDPAPEAGIESEVGADPATAPAGDDASASTEEVAAASPDATTPAPAAFSGLRARTWETSPLSPIGSLDPDTGFMMQIEFSPWGAGVSMIQLSEHYHSIRQTDHYHVQAEHAVAVQGRPDVKQTLTPLAAREVRIGGTPVFLYSAADTSTEPPTFRTPWREESPGVFVAEVEDAEGVLVARVHRVYELAPGTYDFTVRQWIENASDRPLDMQWVQWGPVELMPDDSGYRLQARRLRVGFLEAPQFDPAQQRVVVDAKLEPRTTIIKNWEKDRTRGRQPNLWPNLERFERAGDLAWVAQSNRYFVCALHPLVDPAAASADKTLHLADRVYASVLPVYADGKLSMDASILSVEIHSDPISLAPGGRSDDLDFGVYAGPLDREVLQKGTRTWTDPALPVYRSLALSDIIVYNLGGMCMVCTFQPLAHGLLWLLLQFDAILGDWALAIILLVFCVRGALHPITRRSQIGIQRFSKQMQAISPKIKKLQEKYRDDKPRLQTEMARLYKEEGVNFANALGCLPMFLQTPIWIALYAMLYFAIELRHEPAFYGVFQAIGGWPFLADLSVPDRFIMLPRPFEIPVLSAMWGSVQSLNILPIVLGFVFFVHQKYMSPPTSATMTPEQQQQQKIMKVMMVVLFPFMLYNAPSGLTIYFITNSTLGILESRWIRAHIDKEDLEPKKPTPPAGRRKVQNVAQPKKELPRRRFKERD